MCRQSDCDWNYNFAIRGSITLPKVKNGSINYFYNGSAAKAEKGLEISAIAVVDVTNNISYTLSVQQIPGRQDAQTITDDKMQVNPMKSRRYSLWLFLLIKEFQ